MRARSFVARSIPPWKCQLVDGATHQVGPGSMQTGVARQPRGRDLLDDLQERRATEALDDDDDDDDGDDDDDDLEDDLVGRPKDMEACRRWEAERDPLSLLTESLFEGEASQGGDTPESRRCLEKELDNLIPAVPASGSEGVNSTAMGQAEKKRDAKEKRKKELDAKDREIADAQRPRIESIDRVWKDGLKALKALRSVGATRLTEESQVIRKVSEELEDLACVAMADGTQHGIFFAYLFFFLHCSLTSGPSFPFRVSA